MLGARLRHRRPPVAGAAEAQDEICQGSWLLSDRGLGIDLLVGVMAFWGALMVFLFVLPLPD